MFVKVISRLNYGFSRWRSSEEGVAATEAALVFPILLVLLLGTFDMGRAILSNQKTIRASQVTADLITRDRSVSISDVDEAVVAGELALSPFPTDTFGVEIVSIRFDADANPEVVWRVLRGNISENTNILNDVASLAEAGSGVVVVAVEYEYRPVFGNFVVGDIPMREVAFARGRKSAVVSLE